MIAIALQLLDHHQRKDLSLREVARRAVLTSKIPAHHFDNKLGLLAACAEAASGRAVHAHMESVDSRAGPEDGLRS